MSASHFAPAFSFFSALSATPFRPLHTLVRTTEERFRPAQISLHSCPLTAPQALPAGRSGAQHEHRATVLRERGVGRVPTIVLGGLVPDASEQVFLLRRFLLRSGDIYYLHYSRNGFSVDAICTQLTELVAELTSAGQPPILFGVSFGAGIVLEWLRRARVEHRPATIAGVVFISPVTCVADLIAPGTAKPSTLLGRALKPFLDPTPLAPEAIVDKGRALFLRMFEAGAQNKQALRTLMTKDEAERLRTGVMGTIRGVTAEGARRRVQALAEMVSPTDYFSPAILPLTPAPALILFAEREDTVLDDAAPVRLAFERAPRAYFPQGMTRLVTAKSGDAPVQHASLIFHVFEFLPSLQAFYQRVRRGSLAIAA